MDTTWNILVADDEVEVFFITQLVLEGQEFEGRKICVYHAINEDEVFKELASDREYCVILLDVVISHDNSAFIIIDYIRNVLHNTMIRIILRTAYPGMAPELKVIKEYDINDYRDKTELSSLKLFTSVISAIRGYRDLKIIDTNRKSLEQIIHSSQSIIDTTTINTLVRAILQQISLLIGHTESSLIAHSPGIYATNEDHLHNFVVQCGTGKYEQYEGQQLINIITKDQFDVVNHAIQHNRSIFKNNIYARYFSDDSHQNIIIVEAFRTLDSHDEYMISLFQSNYELVYHNIKLNLEIQSVLNDVIFKIADIAESHSNETGVHIRRVSEYTYLLATLSGINVELSHEYRLAATMHDVGKISIQDSILNKPDKLTDDEFKLIQQHTITGYNLLNGTSKPIFMLAASVCRSHHERWNGTGYPDHLQGEDIPQAARIVAIVDVWDALIHDRCYKAAWSIDDAIEYFKTSSGTQFDPYLTEIFINNIQRFIDIDHVV